MRNKTKMNILKQPTIPKCPYPKLNHKDFNHGERIMSVEDLVKSKAGYFFFINQELNEPQVRSREEVFGFPLTNIINDLRSSSVFEAQEKVMEWILVEPAYVSFQCPYCGKIETRLTGNGNLWRFCPHCGKRVEDVSG